MADNQNVSKICHDAIELIRKIETGEVTEPSSSNTGAICNVPNAMNLPNTSFTQEFGRCFPTLSSQRNRSRSSNRKRYGGSSSAAIAEKKKGRPQNVVVHKDLIIIPEPTTKTVPTHKNRVELEKRGLVVHEFAVDRTWKAPQLRIAIRKQLPNDEILFEFVKSCYGELIKPKLAPGVEITGEVLLKLCGQGCIYVRVLESIVESSSEESDNDEEFSNPIFGTGLGKYESSAEPEVTDLTGLDDGTFTHTSSIISRPSSTYTSVTRRKPPVSSPSSSCTITSQPTTEQTLTATICTTEPQQYNLQDLPEIQDNLATPAAPCSYAELPLVSLTVHRTNIKADMLAAFSDPSIMNSVLDVTIIDNCGNEEEGRGSGVLREAFSLFWKDAYDSLMLGVDQRVPYIRHDYNRQKWEAIGRILVKGLNECSYFPLQLAKSFVAVALFGDESVPLSTHMESFIYYVSEDEREVIKSCLANEMKCKDEQVEELMSTYDCKRIVKDDNIVEVLHELAHKELVQKPQYVMDCWNKILDPLRLVFPTIESLETFYSKITPTTAKVVSMLTSSPITPAEQECFSHLKRFVKGLKGEQLKMFLQFTTGSEIIDRDTINVTYLGTVGFARRPVFHTCGSVLELPSTYESFCELREEFSSVLSNDKLVTFNIR